MSHLCVELCFFVRVILLMVRVFIVRVIVRGVIPVLVELTGLPGTQHTSGIDNKLDKCATSAAAAAIVKEREGM
jgi:hypothetical protein